MKKCTERVMLLTSVRTVVVAEKPSVGRDLARILGCKSKGDGFLYDGSHVVTWAIGHLLMLKEPDDYDDRYRQWRRETLPILPDEMGIKPVPKTLGQLRTIKKLLNHKDTIDIICATDSGREGELIFRYIYMWCGCKKPVKRLWISSLTDEAIKSGLAKMKDASAYDNLYASAKCRSEADWIVGMNGTRAYTLRSGELLPVGRVQTPTLAMIVTRDSEIDAFIPEEYHEVAAEFETKVGEKYVGTWIREGDAAKTAEGKEDKHPTRIMKAEDAKAIAERVKGQKAVVASIKTEEKRQPPPQLFDLTELQREMNKKRALSAKETLAAAQSLYEKHKMITYPRTDSRYLSDDMLPKLNGIMGSFSATEYGEYLAGAQVAKSPRIFNNNKVTDHHAIIPTGKQKSLSSLSASERAVYDRIARNFIAAFHPPYVYDITSVHTKVGNDVFISKGRTDKDLGWTILYLNDKREQEPPIPLLTNGEELMVANAKAIKKKTEPPKPHTEATLLSMMENAGRFVDDETLKEALKASGLGTPATRAQIIEKLISSGYVERRKKNLTATEKGRKLIALVPPELKQAKTTAKWEKALTKIADGTMSVDRFMDSIRKFASYLVDPDQVH